MEACFPVLLKKGEEVLPPDTLDLRWLYGLCCHFVGRSGDDRSQPENISRHSDLENQGPTLPRSTGKLDLTGADDEDAIARAILPEELRTFREIRLHADRVEVAECPCVEIAEHSERAKLATTAIAHRSSCGKGRHSEYGLCASGIPLTFA